MRVPWKKLVYHAAEQAYIDEVVRTGMEQHYIGEWNEFSSKEDWIESRVQEWIEDVIGVDEEAKK